MWACLRNGVWSHPCGGIAHLSPTTFGKERYETHVPIVRRLNILIVDIHQREVASFVDRQTKNVALPHQIDGSSRPPKH